MVQALINVPAKAKRGQLVEIKALISHPMETGYRHTDSGEPVPRDIIHTFVAVYNGEEVFRAELFPAIAANPFISFFTLATESGVIALSWTDDRGATETRLANITVE
jgi:sulfur-oxidizing protein SoxZ